MLLDDGNLENYNKYFGYLDNNTRIYTAPERWYSTGENVDLKTIKTPQMDIFSVGCVIAELMMDGLPLFDLARLQQHRK